MALPHAVITTPVSMPLNARISSSLIIEGPFGEGDHRSRAKVNPAERPWVVCGMSAYSIPR